jgi:hypothetical protein
MAADVKLPGLGHVSKKTLMIGGVVGGGVLAYAYYRHSKSASATAGTDASGTAGTDSSGIDPATGYPYGSTEDEQALAAQQDSGLNTNQLGTGSTDPITGYPYGSPEDEQALQEMGYETGGGGGGSTGTTGTSTTNAQWEQECITNLEAGGVAQSTISAAESGLPRYLAKLSLSAAQATAVQIAVGLTGQPPVGGPYAIIRTPAAPPSQAGVTVPSLKGLSGSAAKAKLEAAGLKDHQVPAATPKGKHATVTSQSPAAGKKVSKGSSVTVHVSTSAEVGLTGVDHPKTAQQI